MNAIQRAWRYITRKPTKSILLIITFFVIGNLVILGLGISQAADNAKVLTRKQMRAVVSYEADYNAYYKYIDSLTDQDEIDEAYKHYPKTDKETTLKLAADSRVKAVNYMLTNAMYSVGFENVPVGNEEQRGTSTMVTDDGEVEEYRDPNIMVYANMYPNMIELEEGTFDVVEGRFYSQDDIDNNKKVGLVTKELAEQNGLKVGDTISITGAGNSYDKQMYTEAGLTEEDLNFTFEIIGIYTTKNDVNPNDEQYKWMSPYQSPKNIILVPYTTLDEYTMTLQMKYIQHLQETDPDMYGDLNIEDYSSEPSKVVYLLDDPLNVDSFVEDHAGDIAQYTILNANNETFKKLARPLDTMSFFANIVVWIVVVNAVVIISLVTALTLKTREYEIGVLLSLGVSKIKVIGQLFVELIVIAAVGFLLAAGSGSLIAGKVGDAVLEYQTNTEAKYDTESDDIYYWSDSTDYFTEVTQDDLLSQYHVSVSLGLILEIYLIGTAVVLIAIMVPSAMIMRLNPKQILLETN